MGFSILGWAKTRSRILHRYVQQAQYQIGARHFEGLSGAGNQSYSHGRVNVFEAPQLRWILVGAGHVSQSVSGLPGMRESDGTVGAI